MQNLYLCVIPADAGIPRHQERRDSRWRLPPQCSGGGASDDGDECDDTLSSKGTQAFQGAGVLLRAGRKLHYRKGLVQAAVVALALVVTLPTYAQEVKGFLCGPFRLVGRFQSPQITECSGLVASRKNPGVLWVHNDSGDGARLFAVSENGTLRGTYHLTHADAFDWEDMALGPCTNPGNDCLYVGDIGDNKNRRPEIQVYRVEEPPVPPDGGPVEVTLKGTERFECRYPDGPHDAETLLVDPDTGIPYVVTKESEGTAAGVYRFPGRPEPGKIVTLEKAATLSALSTVTGGDVTRDGSMIVLRDYFSAYGYPRPLKAPFERAFDASPLRLPLPLEEQGESLGFAPSGTAVYTASEGLQGPIHKALCTGATEPKVSSGTP